MRVLRKARDLAGIVAVYLPLCLFVYLTTALETWWEMVEDWWAS